MVLLMSRSGDDYGQMGCDADERGWMISKSKLTEQDVVLYSFLPSRHHPLAKTPRRHGHVCQHALVHRPAHNITMPCLERRERRPSLQARGAMPKCAWGLGVRRKQREPVVTLEGCGQGGMACLAVVSCHTLPQLLSGRSGMLAGDLRFASSWSAMPQREGRASGGILFHSIGRSFCPDSRILDAASPSGPSGVLGSTGRGLDTSYLEGRRSTAPREDRRIFVK